MTQGSPFTRHELIEVLDKLPQAKVGVYGDHCLDRYMVGRMEAISRDAPVPIVRLHEDTYSPGGGGNVAMNLRVLGARVFALGAVGNDVSAEILRARYERAGIDDDFLCGVRDRFTITFSKLYASAVHGNPQQVARFDRENNAPLIADAEDQVKQAMDRIVPQLDAVMICDYEEVPQTGGVTAKVLARLHDLAREHRVILAADSRMRIGRIGPVDIAMPNDLEAAAASGLLGVDHRGEIGDELVEQAAAKLSRRTGIHHLVITRGERGMTVFEAGNKLADVTAPAAKAEIDVTGAGDTALAALLLAHLSGFHILKAAALANLAAHVTIHKLNTTGTVTAAELLNAYDNLHRTQVP